MSLSISKGIKIYTGVQLGKIYQLRYFTLQNYIWGAYIKHESPVQSYDVSYAAYSSMVYYRDEPWWRLYLLPNRNRDVGFNIRDKVLIAENVPLPGERSMCLIDIDVRIYNTGQRLILVYNNNEGKTFYKPNTYYLAIIISALDTLEV